MKLLCSPVTQDRILDFFYPPHCPVCGKRIVQPPAGHSLRLICPECLRQLTLVGENYCMWCGKPLTNPGEEYCPDCIRRPHAFVQNRSVFSYHGAVRSSLYRLKYANRREYARFYALAVCARLRFWIQSLDIDVIVPIPLYPGRLRKRGYNQAELIAERIGALLGIEEDAGLLFRIKNTAVQKTLSGEERRRNLKHAFAAAGKVRPGTRILLVDDIYTTGTTLDAAAITLLEAGAAEVYGVCVATGG